MTISDIVKLLEKSGLDPAKMYLPIKSTSLVDASSEVRAFLDIENSSVYVVNPPVTLAWEER